MLTFLSGGTGTPKLLRGIKRIMPSEEICVIANTGEDMRISGIYFSPDVDSVVYSLAGMIDTDLWYGIGGDSFITHDSLLELGHDELLRIGDRDRATKIFRTMMIDDGMALSDATAAICNALGVKESVFPMTDDAVRTTLFTDIGQMAFHDYWVRDRGDHKLSSIEFKGSDGAAVPQKAKGKLSESDAIIIGPSNPITSILPILSVKGIRRACKDNYTMAISPINRGGVFSGPAARLMDDLGYEVSPLGVAKAYDGLLDSIVIDRSDEGLAKELKDTGIDVFITDIAMKDLNKSISLGRNILDFLVIN